MGADEGGEMGGFPGWMNVSYTMIGCGGNGPGNSVGTRGLRRIAGPLDADGTMATQARPWARRGL